jgi:orotidine-5'-phosphate decarboxylase
MLGLGFIHNWHKKRKKKEEKQEKLRSGAQEAQVERRRLASAYTVAGAWVRARTGIQDERKKRKRARSKRTAGTMTPHIGASFGDQRRTLAHKQQRRR